MGGPKVRRATSSLLRAPGVSLTCRPASRRELTGRLFWKVVARADLLTVDEAGSGVPGRALRSASPVLGGVATRALLVAALLLPVAALGAFAWQDWREAWGTAERELARQAEAGAGLPRRSDLPVM